MSVDSYPATARTFGRFNGLGLWTLYKKEVQRFLRIFPQTLLAPMISNLLFLIIFMLAFSGARAGAGAGDVPYDVFLLPGLIMMGILNNASANSSSSLMTGKLMGNIVDVLMPPLSPGELAFGYISGAATRGVMVGAATAVALMIFVPVMPQHFWA